MNSVYKEPTVYKQGLDEQDVENIVSSSEWVDISNKIGTLAAPSPSNVKIYYNSILSLIFIRAYMQLSNVTSGRVAVYNFNNDLPGINATFSANAMFFYDGPCYIEQYKCGYVCVFPYTEGTPIREKAISFECDSFKSALASFTIRFNNQFKEELSQYLANH